MFLHLILCCPSPYCIPHAIIECRMTILISYFPCLTALPSANNQTLRIHRQTLISGWIGQMPAVLDDYPLNRYFLLYSTKVQSSGPRTHVKHEARELQSNYWNNTLLQRAVRLATCALTTQKNSPRKKWWISAVKMTSFCNLWSQPYHAV